MLGLSRNKVSTPTNVTHNNRPSENETPAKINLIRAIYDEADKVVKQIDSELSLIEQRKKELLVQREAHIEMHAVATKYVSQLSVTVKRN